MFGNLHQKSSDNIIETDNIIYMLNYDEKTANIISIRYQRDEIILPRSFVYKSTEYITKCICERAFQFSDVKIIQIPDDSEIETIESEAFKLSKIESLTIPPSLINLAPKWSVSATNLKRVRVSPNNPRYRSINDQIIVGKNSLDDSEFDIFVFCSHDVKTVTIPKFVKHIGTFCFNECKLLDTIEFEKDSELQTIGKCAFSGTSIASITIPSSLTVICECAFSFCLSLVQIEIPDNSELQTIERAAFNFVPIKSLKIPSKLVDLQRGWCSELSRLNAISVMVNNPRFWSIDEKVLIEKSSFENDEFDILSFYQRDVQFAEIPRNVKTIGPFAFQKCKKLKTVDFHCDSNLQVIESKAFAFSSITRFSVPSKLTRICSDAFAGCICLRSVEIEDDSKLQIIEEGAFSKTPIECFKISSNVTNIEKLSFSFCKRLQIVEICENAQIRSVLQDSFAGCEQVIVMIPVELNIEFLPSSKTRYKIKA